MNLATEWFIAQRYLRARKSEGFISVISLFSLLGIALGVATLIIVLSVMNGFREELLGRILGLNGHMNVYGMLAPIKSYGALTEKIGQVDGVVAAFPEVEGQALLTYNGQARGAMVRGIAPLDLARKPIISQKIVEGTVPELLSDNVLIGRRMAEGLNVRPGDKITLLSPVMNSTPFGSMPRAKAYTIAGIFDVGMFEYDSSFIFMPLRAAQAFFNFDGTVNTIEIITRDPQHLQAQKKAITQIAGGGNRVSDWQDSNASYFNAIQVERNVMFIILTLIVIVAAFNIISGLIMLVRDKNRDIAILRTMGAGSGNILRVFFMMGATLGIIGTLSGLLLGVGFALNIESIRQGLQHLTGTDLFSPEIYFLSKLPAKLDWREVWVVVSIALTLTFGATFYPAWRASKLQPIDILRQN